MKEFPNASLVESPDMCQKLLGYERVPRADASCHSPKQLVDDVVLCEDIPFGHPFKLAFAEHVHGFIVLDRPLRHVECFES
jgi:hypothetical protein